MGVSQVIEGVYVLRIYARVIKSLSKDRGPVEGMIYCPLQSFELKFSQLVMRSHCGHKGLFHDFLYPFIEMSK